MIILFIPRINSDDENKEKNVNAKASNLNIIELIKKYPSFFLMVLATIFAMCFQNADCGYLIDIIEGLGGDSSELGTANAIAAMVEIPIMFSAKMNLWKPVFRFLNFLRNTSLRSSGECCQRRYMVPSAEAGLSLISRDECLLCG